MGDHHHDLSPVYHSPIEPINCLLRLVLVLVPHEREASGVTSPAVPGDVDVDDLAILVEEREEVISRRPEGDVEDEEGVGVADWRRAGSPEARHLAGDAAARGRGAAGGWRWESEGEERR